MSPSPITVTAARWNADGSTEVLVGDRWARIGARTILLVLGFSVLNDDEGPLHRSSSATLPERLDLGMGEQELQGFTSDPVVVVLARRAWDAEHSNQWVPRMVPVPTRAEAEAELGQWMTPEQLYGIPAPHSAEAPSEPI